MKKFYSLKLQALFLLVGLTTASAQYGDGIIIANEGNFGSYNATVSYLDRETQLLTNDIYNTVNDADVGDVLQNIGIHEDKAYLVVNNSNKVIVVDRETFVEEAIVTDHVMQPRYITFANDKYYVTNSTEQNVTVYDIDTNEYIAEIEIGATVEEIESVGDYVFVQNGWFGSGDSFTVIDTSTDTIAETINIENGINGMDADEDYVYVISSSSDYTHIYKVDGSTLEIVSDVRTTEVAGGGKISVSDGVIYFTGNGNNVYAYTVDELEGEPVHIFEVTDNSWSTFYGFNVINGFAYSADAMGFVAPAVVTIYDVVTGEELNNFTTGMGANGFYPNFANMSTADIANNQLDVAVYPNPVVNYVSLNGVDNAKVEVYNVNGKLVKTVVYNGEQLNMTDLKSGLYFFVISTQDSKVTKKVLVK